MLVAAAVCPQTPLLVPQVANGAAEELADVRDASIDAVSRLRSAKPDVLIAIAPGGDLGAREVRFGGTFRGFGVEFAVGDDGAGDAADGDRGLGEPCVGLLVGRWLLDGSADGASSASITRSEGWHVGEHTEPGECERIGRALAARSERVALLIMGDGSARRTVKAPGYLDERAVPFDDEVARALAVADGAALAAIDPTAASDLMAAGRASWQVLAGAVGGNGVPWRGDLLSYCAPYGVGYFTAVWTPRG